jgi:hypothetical protein
MMVCFAVNFDNNLESGKYRIFRFPADSVRRQQWPWLKYLAVPP